MSDPTRDPEPWYFQPAARKWLQPKAHKLRNFTLILGYYAGMATLIAGPIVGLLYLFAPATVQPMLDRYPALSVGALAGFLLGTAAASWYRRRFPENPKGVRVLLPLVTGLGSLSGAAFAFGGSLAGEAVLFVTAFGVLAYIYMEALPPTDPPSDAT